MTPDRLKKYLAYYRKLLREDPENIEARLRLAALFREMGHLPHAIEEYIAASKLLAAQGLPLEAIAACKAVLELDPTHTEVQLFLARLFAQAPDAASGARVARPVKQSAGARQRQDSELQEVTRITHHPMHQAQAELLSTQEMDAFERSGAEPIALLRPKSVSGASGLSLGKLRAPGLPEVPTRPLRPEDVPTIARDVRAEIDARAGMLDFDGIFGDEGSEAEPFIEPMPTRGYAPEQEAMHRDASVSGLGVQPRQADLRTTFEMDPYMQAQLERSSMGKQPGAEPPTNPQRRVPPDVTRDVPMHELLGELRDLSLRETRELELPPEADESATVQRSLADMEETFKVSVFRTDNLHVSEVNAERISAMLDELSAPSDEVSWSEEGDAPEAELRIRRAELPKIPLLSRLDRETFARLVRVMELREVPAGQIVLDWREEAQSLFIIIDGAVEATKVVSGREVVLGELGRGEFFGEFGVLTGRDRHAVVRAVRPTKLFALSQRTLQALGEHDPKIWDALWAAYHQRLLNNMMASHVLFRGLDAAAREAVVGAFRMREIAAHDVLTRPDEACPLVGFVAVGELGLEDEAHGAQRLEEGEFFGLVAALSHGACRAQVRARRDSTVLTLPADDWRELVRARPTISAALRHLLQHATERHHLLWAELEVFPALR